MKIEDIRKEKENIAESMLRTQFKMELIVYTQDTTYSKKLGKRKREGDLMNSVDTGATLKEMMKHLKSYYQVSVIEMLYILFCAS